MLLASLAVSCHGGGGAERDAGSTKDRPALGLLTSLPIYWGEPAAMSDLLDTAAEPHWARAVLEEDHVLVPLDVLGQPDGRPTPELARMNRLLVAQPRGLSPADNVALDMWVRGGGRLLLVLDPRMTDHSDYPLGDKRRFNDVALVPPVLARWGLSMRHAEGTAERDVLLRNGTALPVADYGLFEATSPSPGDRPCMLTAERIVARCAMGEGRVTVVADAAFLNREDAPIAAASAARFLVADAFE